MNLFNPGAPAEPSSTRVAITASTPKGVWWDGVRVDALGLDPISASGVNHRATEDSGRLEHVLSSNWELWVLGTSQEPHMV